MSGAADGRIRLTILGGFLGSGKTTWLRHQLHHGLIRDALVIVNEAAEIPVDNTLLAHSSRLSVLAGGCACCNGRAALVHLLRELCAARVGSDDLPAQLDHIVLETSGLADPGPIVDTIRTDPILVHHIKVNEIVVAVDALHGLDQLRREPLNRPQIETADRLVVTKLDRAGRSGLGRLLATLRVLNPGAALFGAIMGSPADLPDSAGELPEALPDASGSAGNPIRAVQLDLPLAVDWTAFTVWLSALLHARGDDVIRVKGVIRTPAGRLLLQSVRKSVQQPEILPEPHGDDEHHDNLVAFIGRGFEAATLHRSLRVFVGLAQR